ncbi:MAG: chemotaxis protein CheW [Aliidongia sp.]
MGIGAPDRRAASWLVCRAGGRLCALPLDGVREAMRPLPIDTMAHAPAFVLGLSIIRGTPVPVVDAGLLAGERPVVPGRYVTVEVGGPDAGAGGRNGVGRPNDRRRDPGRACRRCSTTPRMRSYRQSARSTKN